MDDHINNIGRFENGKFSFVYNRTIVSFSINSGKVLKVSRSCYYNWIIKGCKTIKIDEKFSHILLTKTSIVAVLLQLTNVILTASKDN